MFFWLVVLDCLVVLEALDYLVVLVDIGALDYIVDIGLVPYSAGDITTSNMLPDDTNWRRVD